MSNETYSTRISRIYGTELEYGLLFDNSFTVPERFFYNLPDEMGNSRQYRKNGARIYPDCSHAEYASAECGTLDDMVAADLAGEEIMSTALQNLVGDSPQAYRLHKRSIDNQQLLYGAHESYCVDKSIRFKGKGVPAARREYLVQALAIHYVSRIPLVGGGYFDARKNQWYVSPRSQALRTLENGNCNHVSSRPLVDTRDEPLANSDLYRRLHVSHGEPNISPRALRIKVGMTSAFVGLLEADVPMDHLFLRDPLEAAYAVGADTTLSVKLELHDGRKMTALELVETIAEKILDMAGIIATPPDELAVAEDAYNLCGNATKDIGALMYNADWYTRQQLSEQKAARSKYGGNIIQRRAAFDQMYDAIVVRQPGGEPMAGFGKRLRDEKGKFGPLDHARIKRLQSSPPSSSRALLRGKLIEAAANPEIQQHYGTLRSVDWQQLVFGSPSELRFDLSEPALTKPTNAMKHIFSKAGISLET